MEKGINWINRRNYVQIGIVGAVGYGREETCL